LQIKEICNLGPAAAAWRGGERDATKVPLGVRSLANGRSLALRRLFASP
jgi:hypothetical protein